MKYKLWRKKNDNFKAIQYDGSKKMAKEFDEEVKGTGIEVLYSKEKQEMIVLFSNLEYHKIKKDDFIVKVKNKLDFYFVPKEEFLIRNEEEK
jgi:hypothetical protein